MFDSKYSKMLTIILTVGIIIIVGMLLLTGYLIQRNKRLEKEALEAVEQFQGDINKNKNNNENDESNIIENTTDNGSTEIVTPELNNIEPNIIADNNANGDNSATSSAKYYKGFVQVGTIEIPAINLSYPVLKDASIKSLDVSVGILDGPGLNKVGNTTIAGHNYRDGRFFSNNKKLVEGDKVHITDETGRKITYSIYKIFTTSESDSSFLDRDTEGKREITLDTCTDDTKSRLIIFAKEQ